MNFAKQINILSGIILIFILSIPGGSAQENQQKKYWNQNTQLVPWRLPLLVKSEKYRQIDLDHDGDPDLIYTTINDSIPAIWIDDDDDMKWGRFRG